MTNNKIFEIIERVEAEFSAMLSEEAKAAIEEVKKYIEGKLPLMEAKQSVKSARQSVEKSLTNRKKLYDPACRIMIIVGASLEEDDFDDIMDELDEIKAN